MTHDELKNYLMPFLEDFVDDLILVQTEIANKDREAEIRLESIDKQQKDFKEYTNSENKRLKVIQDKLEDEIARYKKLQAELQEEITQYNRSINEQSVLNNKVKETLDGAEAERKLALEERKKQEKATQDYAVKTELLNADREIIEKRKRELEDRDAFLRAKDSAITAREVKVIQQEGELDEKDINIRTKEKRVNLEMKRLNLNV